MRPGPEPGNVGTDPSSGDTLEFQPITTGLAHRIDHVILGIDDLDRGVELLREATGVTASLGGAHPGRGTRNALVGLGRGCYLELLAPNPDDVAGPTVALEFARYQSLAPIGWAIGTRDIDGVLSAAGADTAREGGIRPGARHRPDGTSLRWRTLTPWSGPNPLLPFYIEWDRASAHPSTDLPRGCRLAGFALASPTADSLTATLQGAGVPISVAPSTRPEMLLTLDCAKGRISFRNVMP